MLTADRTLATLVRRGDKEGTRQHLAHLPPRDVARALRRLGAPDLEWAFRTLPADRADEVFVQLDNAVRVDLLSGLPERPAADLFALLDPDDQAWVCDHVKEPHAARLLASLSPRDRDLTEQLMAYPVESVGRAMSPHVVALTREHTAGQAMDRIRERGREAETIYMLPLLDEEESVVGVVSLRRLILSDPGAGVWHLASRPPVLMRADQDLEEAARLVRRARLIAAPVVDGSGRLVGVFTVDDAMRIMEEVDEEDAARGTGSERLGRAYQAVPFIGLVRSRIGWLLVLILAATLTVNVLDYFEETLSQVVALALFVPLLIGTGGNAGAQSATTVVRAMAVGDIGPGDAVRVLAKELATGLVCGLVLAAVTFVPATVFADRAIAEIVCLALVVICVLATTVGALIPMVARRIGVDPAVVSAPFISTIVDATGLLVYFVIAETVLGLR